MAFFTGNIYSKVLDMDTQLQVVYPEDKPAGQESEKPAGVFYLLHGLSANASAWSRYSSVERYANERNLVLVMPEVQRSFYMDLTYGMRYFTYLTEELPGLIKRIFGLSFDREHTFVAGLSMGGFGALKMAFNRPDIFGGCGSLSGAVDMKTMMAHQDEMPEMVLPGEITAALGIDGVIQDQDDIVGLIQKSLTKPENERPRLYFTCGKQDFIYPLNQYFKGVLEQIGYPHTYTEYDGVHDWYYWDKTIVECMDALFPR